MSDRTAARRMREHRRRQRKGRIRILVDVHEERIWAALLEAGAVTREQADLADPLILGWALSHLLERLSRSP